jgi:acyl-CoA dehydrogenase
MNLELGGDLEAFRREVREFLVDHLDADGFFHHEGDHHQATQRLYRALGERNWLALAWPTEVGGEGRHPLYEFVLWNEMARCRAARPPLGSGIVAKTIIVAGTEDQKARFLPPLRTGEIAFSLGYSEPEAGSDLAGLRTRAVRDGDVYRLTGEKRWTSGGHRADYLWVLCRTGALEDRGRALTILIVDRRSPGITISPIPTATGERFNEIFLDEVEVPVANRVGEEGKGWTYGKYLLEFERGAGIASAKLRDALKTISNLAESEVTGRAIDDPDIVLRMSEIEVDIDTLEMTELRVLSALQTGQNPGAVSSLLTLRNSEIRQAVTRLGVDVIGNDGLYVEPVRPLYRLNETPGIPEELLPVVPEYLNGRAYTIFGGSSEIQREIVAKMVLGL